MCCVEQWTQISRLDFKWLVTLPLARCVTSSYLFMFSEYQAYPLSKESVRLGESSQPCYFSHWCSSIDSEVNNLLLLEIKSGRLQTTCGCGIDKFSPVMSFSPTHL